MKFISTRTNPNASDDHRRYSFEEAALSGWADDGGMLLPESFPCLDQDTLTRMADLSYPRLCEFILRQYIDVDQVGEEDLTRIIDESFAKFGSDQVVDVVPVETKDGCVINACELWGGPTLAFKDLGMTVLANLLNFFVERKGGFLQLLVGTSGDTGSSAIEAVGDLPRINIVCLYPKDRCSAIQELQMTTANQRYSNSKLFRVQGSSDDLDVPIEAVFRDTEFKNKHCVGSVNSVNIVRVLVQSVHYFYAFFQTNKQRGTTNKPCVFVVPTGAGGHVTSGVIAKKMGLPVAALHVATNTNDIFHRFLSHDNDTSVSELYDTNSPSMDIQVPYNIERLLWLASDFDGDAVGEWITGFKTSLTINVPREIVQSMKAKFAIQSSVTNNDQVESCIRRVYQESGYMLDPHTAVGVQAALEHHAANASETPVVFMCCAHPGKFAECVSKSLSITEGEFKACLPNMENRHVARVIELSGAVPEGFDELNKGEDWVKLVRESLLGKSM